MARRKRKQAAAKRGAAAATLRDRGSRAAAAAAASGERRHQPAGCGSGVEGAGHRRNEAGRSGKEPARQPVARQAAGWSGLSRLCLQRSLPRRCFASRSAMPGCGWSRCLLWRGGEWLPLVARGDCLYARRCRWGLRGCCWLRDRRTATNGRGFDRWPPSSSRLSIPSGGNWPCFGPICWGSQACGPAWLRSGMGGLFFIGLAWVDLGPGAGQPADRTGADRCRRSAAVLRS